MDTETYAEAKVRYAEARTLEIFLDAVTSTVWPGGSAAGTLVTALRTFSPEPKTENESEVSRFANALLDATAQLFGEIRAIENLEQRVRLAEGVGTLARLVANIAKFDRISGYAKGLAKTRLKPAKAALSRRKTDRRDAIRDAAYKLFDAHQKLTNGQLLVILTRDNPVAFKNRKGEDLDAKTARGDIRALREEWSSRKF